MNEKRNPLHNRWIRDDYTKTRAAEDFWYREEFDYLFQGARVDRWAEMMHWYKRSCRVINYTDALPLMDALVVKLSTLEQGSVDEILDVPMTLPFDQCFCECEYLAPQKATLGPQATEPDKMELVRDCYVLEQKRMEDKRFEVRALKGIYFPGCFLFFNTVSVLRFNSQGGSPYEFGGEETLFDEEAFEEAFDRFCDDNMAALGFDDKELYREELQKSTDQTIQRDTCRVLMLMYIWSQKALQIVQCPKNKKPIKASGQKVYDPTYWEFKTHNLLMPQGTKEPPQGPGPGKAYHFVKNQWRFYPQHLFGNPRMPKWVYVPEHGRGNPEIGLIAKDYVTTPEPEPLAL